MSFEEIGQRLGCQDYEALGMYEEIVAGFEDHMERLLNCWKATPRLTADVRRVHEQPAPMPGSAPLPLIEELSARRPVGAAGSASLVGSVAQDLARNVIDNWSGESRKRGRDDNDVASGNGNDSRNRERTGGVCYTSDWTEEKWTAIKTAYEEKFPTGSDAMRSEFQTAYSGERGLKQLTNCMLYPTTSKTESGGSASSEQPQPTSTVINSNVDAEDTLTQCKGAIKACEKAAAQTGMANYDKLIQVSRFASFLKSMQSELYDDVRAIGPLKRRLRHEAEIGKVPKLGKGITYSILLWKSIVADTYTEAQIAEQGYRKLYNHLHNKGQEGQRLLELERACGHGIFYFLPKGTDRR